MSRGAENMKRSIAVAVAVLLIAVVSACGSKPAATGVPKPTDTVVPTYVYQAPTEPPVFASLNKTEQPTEQAGSSTEAATVDPELITRGQGRYVALACGSCHGDQGEGTDKGSALVPLKLDENGFVKFLQTGGGLGNSHLFAGNKLSETGAHNLYLYVVSLAQSTASP